MTRNPCRITGCHGTAINRRICQKHRVRARLYGDPHATPWATVEPLDVEAVVARQAKPDGLGAASRHEVARRLTALQLSADEIARILSVSPRTIHRWRAQDRTTTTAAE
ncbi:hypothetical protein [Streptomyces sp. RKAG337]|uniref:hypothetical protein n=1 Tax=Streptomyces sp. RKAG337 TaxID=2893404 RepID=UPI0020347ABB|nr:hypothetical protein [Streptomyces sp. RKAG337]MCM2427363.1 hypothetical protein [Streptomyces sp. RKAG337]